MKIALLPIFILPLILSTNSFILGFSFCLILVLLTIATSLVLHFIQNIVERRFLFVFALIISSFFTTLLAIILYFNAPKIFDYFSIALCFLSISQIHFFDAKKIFTEGSSLFGTLKFKLKQVGIYSLLSISISLIREVLGHGTITFAYTMNDLGQIKIPGLFDYPIKIVDSPVFIFVLIAIMVIVIKRKKV